MKKLLLLSLISVSVFAVGQNFPGTEVSLLMGKELKVKDLKEGLRSFGYSDFYINDNFKFENHLYPTNHNIGSNYDSLKNKVFKLISYIPYINETTNKTKYKLIITNPQIGNVYYDYDPNYDFEFIFEVIGGLTYPQGFFCKDIVQKTDKFTGDITYDSPMEDGISFTKIKSKDKVSIYMFIRNSGSTLNINTKGVILLFENGQKIEKPSAKIDVEPSKYSNSWQYSTMFELNAADIKLLISSKITDVRLYIYDDTVEHGSELMEYIKCISNN